MANKTLRLIFAIAMLLANLPLFAHAAGSSELPGSMFDKVEPTIVIVNSNKWQDVYLAGIYANLNSLPIRFIQDPFRTRDFMSELSAVKVTTVYLFSRKDNTVPSLSYLLHSRNLDVREVVFEDHQDLSAKLIDKFSPKSAIVVRDDFGFDALSAKFLSNKLQIPVIFSKGTDEMDGRVFNSLKNNGVSSLFLIGRASPQLDEKLRDFSLQKLQGRDEYDTSNIVSEYIAGDIESLQGVITTGEILELSLLSIKDQPIFIVPDFGTYSLTRTANVIKKTRIQALLGIGKLITDSATWMRQTTGLRVIVKFGTVYARPEDEGFVRKDMSAILDGYELPRPVYDGFLSEIVPSYTDPFGPSTGAMINGNTPAPPVEFLSYFRATGNIDFPAYIVLTVKDEANVTLATLQSPTQMMKPKQDNVFKVKWGNAPSEGKYFVEGRVFGEVYEGINFAPKERDFDLRWIFVIINILLLILALIALVLAIYSSHVISRDIRSFGGIYKRVSEELDGVIKYVDDLYHFRRRRK
ncbi:hypothetical protein HY989_02405 [Candidatus Micrarchaeota archaeon]|nr:hypothetical protein [Candidatus Micrarchaeota archaeon]